MKREIKIRNIIKCGYLRKINELQEQQKFLLNKIEK